MQHVKAVGKSRKKVRDSRVVVIIYSHLDLDDGKEHKAERNSDRDIAAE